MSEKTHQQMFIKADNEEGFVSVICHRERYADDLKKMGFVNTVEELESTEKNDSKADAEAKAKAEEEAKAKADAEAKAKNKNTK